MKAGYLPLMARESLEDDFHGQKASSTLQATFRGTPEAMRRLRHNLLSSRTERVLARIARCSPRFEGLCAKDVMDGNHAAIRVDANDTVVRVFLDHAYVGGSMFYRFVEALLGQRERPLPSNAHATGLAMAVYNARTLFRIHRRDARCAEGPLLHALKQYTLAQSAHPRRFLAYHAFLQDALRAFGRDELTVAFSVVFEGDDVINNVGAIILTARVGMTVQGLADEFRAHTSLASATNTLSNLGRATKWLLRNTATSFRRKVDLVCTSMVVELPRLKPSTKRNVGLTDFCGLVARNLPTLA